MKKTNQEKVQEVMLAATEFWTREQESSNAAYVEKVAKGRALFMTYAEELRQAQSLMEGQVAVVKFRAQIQEVAVWDTYARDGIAKYYEDLAKAYDTELFKLAQFLWQ